MEGLGRGDEARRLAYEIDPLRRQRTPDHLTTGVAAHMLVAQAAEVDRLLIALRSIMAGAGNAEFVYRTARDVLAEFETPNV